MSDNGKELRINQKYIFHFLSPNRFIEYLKDGRLIKGVFRSDLEDRLKSSGEDIENINPLM
jgi:hypothetical protein